MADVIGWDEEEPAPADPPPRPTRRCVNPDCQQLIQEGVVVNGRAIVFGDPCPFCRCVLEPTHALARGNAMVPKNGPRPTFGEPVVRHGLFGYNILGCRCPTCCGMKARANAKTKGRGRDAA